MLRKVSSTLLIFVLVFIHIGDFQTPTTVHAATTVNWSGTLADPDPTWARVSINCIGTPGNIVKYDLQQFSVDTTGSYTITMLSMSGTVPQDAFLALYQNSFDPSQPSTNCIAADELESVMGAPLPELSGLTLTAGVHYILVTTNCCGLYPPGALLNYTNQISGVGNITLEAFSASSPSASNPTVAGAAPRPGPDMIPIPSTAAVGLVLVDTSIYSVPLEGYASLLMITAGKTLWVYGLDSSGQFYKVMLAGKFFWLPVQSMGPNSDSVWNSHPLPVEIVD